MNYSSLNKKAYDDLAKEYEGRTEKLFPVTRRAMNYFVKYIKPRGSVLDVGCGVGITVHVLSKKGFKVTGIEISPRMARFARKRNPSADIVVADFTKKKFRKRFDAVLAFAFIHLFPKPQAFKVAKKIKMVLKPGGVALISSTEALTSKEGWEIKKDFDIKRKRFRKSWTEEEMRDFLENTGFKFVALRKFRDPFGKIWMDFVVQK